jgi:hypothetical protein
MMTQAKYAKTSPKEDTAEPAREDTTQPNKKEKESATRMTVLRGGQHSQVRTNTFIKIWKKVSHLGEEENPSVGNFSVLMGKRKAEIGGSICDDERHLKIRKWEDYLEEETETDFEEFEMETEIENDMAEAAMQPRPQP